MGSSGRMRLKALVHKEFLQMVRDRSTLTLGMVMPLVLLILFGFGLSLDITSVPVAVVREDSSPAGQSLFQTLKLSRYIEPQLVVSVQEAEALMKRKKVDAIVRPSLTNKTGRPPEFQIIVNGRDSNKARIMQQYLEGAIALWYEKENPSAREEGGAVAEPRIWYNAAMESRYFLVPGVIVLIMTLIGALLTALVIAREWERGTYEALIATPASRLEFLAGKIIPYFLLGMAGLGLCLAASYWLFRVPMRGSFALVIACSALYLVVALGIGLFISARTKSQFLASQIVVIVCFLPTLMLSGFIFDLNSVPRFVYYLAHCFPATWYVDMLQTLFLVGDVGTILYRDFAVLGLMAVLMIFLAFKSIRKTLE